MLVIHPKDRTTVVLSVLYEGTESRIFDQSSSNREIESLLRHCSRQERIMLLGHGSNTGLFSKENDELPDFDRIIVGHPHAYHLRRHNGNIVGVWCHAEMFARKEGLHGLFSGMIISEKSEAEEYGIITLQHIIEESNIVMCRKLRELLDEGCPLSDIPERMRNANPHRSMIDDFNYEKFYYL